MMSTAIGRFKLALNAGWDQNLPAEGVVDLDAHGVDLTLAGCAETEIGSLLDHFLHGPRISDEAPDPSEIPVTRLGDLWRIDKHGSSWRCMQAR
jgi:hypothetical protein